jgi:hypothetical protein
MPSKYDTLKFVASEAAAEILNSMETDHASFEQAVRTHSSADRLVYLQETFRSFRLVDLPDDTISVRGRVCHYCVEGIEGANLIEVIDRFRELDPGSLRVTVVREGMTTQFVKMISNLAPIRRLMVCSPWISLGKDRLHQFIHGVEMSKRITGFYPEITVVTRPLANQPGGNETEILSYLRRVNSVIRYHGSLHSKLYILESASSPSQRVAFVGSENFTKLRYQEVGLRIHNDHQLVDDLMRYFMTIGDY